MSEGKTPRECAIKLQENIAKLYILYKFPYVSYIQPIFPGENVHALVGVENYARFGLTGVYVSFREGRTGRIQGVRKDELQGWLKEHYWFFINPALESEHLLESFDKQFSSLTGKVARLVSFYTPSVVK